MIVTMYKNEYKEGERESYSAIRVWWFSDVLNGGNGGWSGCL